MLNVTLFLLVCHFLSSIIGKSREMRAVVGKGFSFLKHYVHF